MERESVIPSLAVIRSLYHPAPLEPRQVPPSKIGVPLSILKVNEINHPARRYIYIYTYRFLHFCCSPPLPLPPLSPSPHIFTVINGEMADIVRLDMFTRDTQRGSICGFGNGATSLAS